MFEDEVLLLTALLEITLPDHTIRLCDGGFVDWPARGMFTAEDSIFGTIESAAGISEATSVLRKGELAVLPTDTVYGVGVDAFSPEAVIALLAAKGRGRQMPPPVLVGSRRAAMAMARSQYRIRSA